MGAAMVDETTNKPEHEVFSMTPDVMRFCRWRISKSPDLVRMAMHCGGFDALINETWIRMQLRKLTLPELRWTTIWGNYLWWTALALWKSRKPERFERKCRDDFQEEYTPQYADYYAADMVRHELMSLTYREREIIKLRYGLGDGYTCTLEEVGRIFKVTRERVRQIESKGMRKLSRNMKSSKAMF